MATRARGLDLVNGWPNALSVGRQPVIATSARACRPEAPATGNPSTVGRNESGGGDGALPQAVGELATGDSEQAGGMREIAIGAPDGQFQQLGLVLL